MRFLNGKTGKPIKDDTPNIWLDDAKDPVNPHTKTNGEVWVSINASQSRDVRGLPNKYADCRLKGNSVAGMQMKYSLEKIITRGVVSDNVWGKHRVEPIPGVLVVYVRPLAFMEKWQL